MPKIFKSGKEFKGNKNSGDKPDSVKIKEKAEEIINNGLANSIANEDLIELSNTPIGKRKHLKIKDVVMPIVLRGMTEKKLLEFKNGLAELLKDYDGDGTQKIEEDNSDLAKRPN